MSLLFLGQSAARPQSSTRYSADGSATRKLGALARRGPALQEHLAQVDAFVRARGEHAKRGVHQPPQLAREVAVRRQQRVPGVVHKLRAPHTSPAVSMPVLALSPCCMCLQRQQVNTVQ